MSCASYELQSQSEIEPTEGRPRIKRKIPLFFHQKKICRGATFIWPTRLPNSWNSKTTLKYSISAHLCIARSRSQETDKQAVAKLKQDYMDITGYLHYARAREVGWQSVGKPEADRIGLGSWPRFSWTSTGH